MRFDPVSALVRIPHCGSPNAPAVSRCDAINEAFTTARDAAVLDPTLDLHCLRHSYITHLIEFDYPEKFVSTQVGHTFAATTAIYTGVSDEYRNRMLCRSLSRHCELWEGDDA